MLQKAFLRKKIKRGNLRMKVKRFLIATSLLLILILSFTGCGFNEDKAKTDSKQQLKNFLSLYKNKQTIVNSVDKAKVKSFITQNFQDYFTDDFSNDTRNAIDNPESTILYQSDNTFYLESSDDEKSTQFYNNYQINSPTINKENQTLTYKLTALKDGSTKLYVNVTMKKEDNKWKIERAN